MEKSLFEQLGGTYHEENGYRIPDLALKDEGDKPIGPWGQRHLQYLKEYRRITYTNLLTSGQLDAYLADIDRQAQERFERIVEQMKAAEGVTEALKERDWLGWVQHSNNIRSRAREIVLYEIIYPIG